LRYNYHGECDVPANGDFVAVDAGAAHSIGLKSDGTILTWGSNGYGQRSVFPVWGTDFAAVAAGGDHGLGLTAR